MNTAIVFFLILSGTFFMVIAAIGLLRLPDLFTRMHASTKAVSLGVGILLVATAAYYGAYGIWTKALLTTVFIFLTAPVASHMIARAAYLTRVPRWEKTVVDEMEAHVHHQPHRLTSPPPETFKKKSARNPDENESDHA